VSRRGKARGRGARSGGGGPRGGARLAALNAALLAEKRGLHLDAALERVLSEDRAADRDRRLAEEIAYGAVRHRGSIDTVISAVSSMPLRKMQLAVLEAIRGAVYQTLFLTRVPDHAAVNEAVGLARSFGGGRAANFANGVLRSALRMRAGRSRGAVAEGERRKSLYFRAGECVLLDRDLLPDPAEDEVGWLAAHYSCPAWLVGRLMAEHGRAPAEAVLRWSNEIPHLGVRVNPLKTDPAAMAQSAAEELCAGGRVFSGCASAVPVPPPGAFVLSGGRTPGSLPGLARGLFTVQDPTQQRAVLALAPRPGERVLDVCAAPGGKATQIAETAGDRGEVLACDPDAERLPLVAEAAARLGLKSIALREVGVPPLPEDMSAAFDAVLVDAPCSNTGAINRRVEARWRAAPEALAALSERQRAILSAALDAVRPGGRLVYSTCSLLDAENGGVVRSAVEGRDGWRLVREETVLPEEGRNDGGYWALLAP
jgi:16S rRNA (cytosine967-C5)-methyltransferase